MTGFLRTRGLAAATVLALAATGLLAAGPAAAGVTTYTVTSDMGCGSVGSFEWAVQQANANPGKDTIEFTPGLLVDYNVCHSISGLPYGVNITEAVDIKGNGAFIDGQQMWADATGQVNPSGKCPADTAGSVLIAVSPGFVDIGTLGADNTGIDVTMDNLFFDRLPVLAKVERNASMAISTSSASRIMDTLAGCNRPLIEAAAGADVTLRSFFLNSSTIPNAVVQEFNSAGLIRGSSGDLVLDHVTFDANDGGWAVDWGTNGTGTAKIVSSKFFQSGGFSFAGATSEIVNSAMAVDSRKVTDRALNFAGTARASASTFVWRWPTCYAAPPNFEICQGGIPAAPDPSTSMGFGTRQTGTWTFATTAIGAGAGYPDGGPLLFNGSWPAVADTTAFTSDALTWVQDTVKQDNTAINAILPGAMTGFPALEPTSDLISTIAGISPLIGSQQAPGKLLDAVSDSACPTGANALINPVDSTCITDDVVGNPRWDVGGARNIGAVQTYQPYLTVTGVDDGAVDLAWNRPAGATAFLLGYKIDGSADPFTEVLIQDPSTLSRTINGLTNGTPYRFVITAFGTGLSSNEVVATPFAGIGTPAPAATPGDGQVHLFWTTPTAGGHPGPLAYFVMYRPKGTQQWILGPSYLSGRTTLIPELTNGTDYELGVFARSPDGTTSLLGVTTATPVGSTPTPPPTPGPTPTPTPSPTPTPKVKQVALRDCVVATGRMPRSGVKVVTRAHCRTNARNAVATRVRCLPRQGSGSLGEARLCGVVRLRNGTVKVRTFGRRVTVTVRWFAPAEPGFTAFRKKAKFRG